MLGPRSRTVPNFVGPAAGSILRRQSYAALGIHGRRLSGAELSPGVEVGAMPNSLSLRLRDQKRHGIP
jgi:hypothetical protein